MKKSLLISTLLVSGLIVAPSASAAGTCEVIYGGGEVCPPALNFTINKKVQNPSKGGEFVENLTVNDSKFAPESTINWQIEVKNTGNKRIDKIDITDEFPQFVNFESGVGNYDASKRTLSFTVSNLEAGKSAVYTIVTKAAKATDLPADSGTTCVINRVRAVADNKGVNTDSSQVCIERQILGTTPAAPGKGKVQPAPKAVTTPSTGPEALALFGLIPMGFGGYFLRRKANLR